MNQPPMLGGLLSSNTSTNAYPAIGGFPIETLEDIFGHHSGVKWALTLSHVCHRWRSVAICTANLWNKLGILWDRRGPVFDTFIQLLEMQLDRAAHLPLDVVWYRHIIDGQDGQILDLLRQKGHFSRWRTLAIQFDGPYRYKPPFSITDAFTNLESSTILNLAYDYAYQYIDRTTTSKLHTLDLRLSRIRNDHLPDLFPNMIKQVKQLITSSSVVGIADSSFLPSNIQQLEADREAVHCFPYVQMYKLALCTFQSRKTTDLRHLTSFTVNTYINVRPWASITLPSLHNLICGDITLGSGAEFHTPVLETLTFRADQRPGINSDLIKRLETIIQSPGYPLSPKNSLTVENCISEDCLVLLLRKSPHIERVSLSFNEPAYTRRIVETISVPGMKSPTVGGLEAKPCKQLSEMRLNLSWEGCDPYLWVAEVPVILGSRRIRGPTPTMQVHLVTKEHEFFLSNLISTNP